MSEINLYQELADRIMMGHSERIKKLFSMIADEDEAKLLLAMPGLPEDLADATGRSVEDVQKALDLLFKKGLAFISGSSGKYRMCRDIRLPTDVATIALLPLAVFFPIRPA